MKFRTDFVTGLLNNDGDQVGKIMRSIDHRQRIVLAQGFGLKESPLPLRVLAYLVGVMRLLSQMPKTATVELYIAMEGVLRANTYARDVIITKAREMEAVMRWYVGERYPQFTNQVRVLVDRYIQPGSDLDNYIQSLMPLAERIAEQNSTIGNFIANRGGTQALRYMLEHAIYMRDPLVDSEPFAGALVNDCATDMDHLIMLGGAPERVFYTFLQDLLQKTGSHNLWISHQIFMRAGDPPTYHHQEGEPCWADRSLPYSALDLLQSTAKMAVSDRDIVIGVLRDLMTLLADMGNIPDTEFRSLIGLEKRVLSGRAIEAQVMEYMQKGWERLKQSW